MQHHWLAGAGGTFRELTVFPPLADQALFPMERLPMTRFPWQIGPHDRLIGPDDTVWGIQSMEQTTDAIPMMGGSGYRRRGLVEVRAEVLWLPNDTGKRRRDAREAAREKALFGAPDHIRRLLEDVHHLDDGLPEDVELLVDIETGQGTIRKRAPE